MFQLRASTGSQKWESTGSSLELGKRESERRKNEAAEISKTKTKFLQMKILRR
jgi:hypothetical protein